MNEINEIRRLAGLPLLHEEEFLYEAAPSKKRLLPMFNAPLQALSAIEEFIEYEEISYNLPIYQLTPREYISNIRHAIESYLDWSREKLIREDRVIYYLRFGLVNVLGQIVSLVDELAVELIKNSDSPEDVAERAGNFVKKLKPALMKKITKILRHDSFTKKDPTEDNMVILHYDFNNLSNWSEHYLSLPIPKIQEVIWDKQTLPELLAKFRTEEEEWQEQSRRRIPAPPGIQVIEQFDDDFAWFNLETAFCSDESEAMGHCGNAPREHTDDLILSLRKVVVSGSDKYHIPHLTFILNGDGELTEMKGRANEKPAKKYHPYIIKLLLNNAIKGIKGGGYAPENNFSLNDLDEKVRRDLMKRKPALADPITKIIMKYEREGVTEELLGDINDGFSDSDSLLIRRAFRDIDDNNRVIIKEKIWFEDLIVHYLGGYTDDNGAGAIEHEFGDTATEDLLRLLAEIDNPNFGLPYSLGTYGTITETGFNVFKKLLSILPKDFLGMVGVDIDNIMDKFRHVPPEGYRDRATGYNRSGAITQILRQFENKFEILSEVMEEAYKKQETVWDYTDNKDDIIWNLQDRLNSYFSIGYETSGGLQAKPSTSGKDPTGNQWDITISPEQAIGILELDAGIKEQGKFTDISYPVFQYLIQDNGYIFDGITFERIDKLRTAQGLSPSTEQDEYAAKLRSEEKELRSNMSADKAMYEFDWDKMKQDVITAWNEIHNTSPEKQYATESFESDIDEIKRLAGL